ncbi:MAG TPA: hypothetical protein VFQ25_10940 [Ktedonobacterales bacterium]|nr:hypothetical protein [Ktedonobacterales bacterium]
MMEDLDDMPSPAQAATSAPSAASVAPRTPVTARQWVSPGVSLRKRIVTGIGVALAATLFILIALYEQTSMLVSTIIGAIFILGFIGYLRVVAPTPYTLQLDESGVTRTNRGAEPSLIPWGEVARVKEERFKNGVSISVTVYKRVGARGLHRAWVVYRDDIPDFDSFVQVFSSALPENAPWMRETVHE